MGGAGGDGHDTQPSTWKSTHKTVGRPFRASPTLSHVVYGVPAAGGSNQSWRACVRACVRVSLCLVSSEANGWERCVFV